MTPENFEKPSIPSEEPEKEEKIKITPEDLEPEIKITKEEVTSEEKKPEEEKPRIIVLEEIGRKRTPEEVEEFKKIREESREYVERKKKLTERKKEIQEKKERGELLTKEEVALLRAEEINKEEKKERENAKNKLDEYWKGLQEIRTLPEGETKETGIDAFCNQAETPIQALTGQSLKERARDNGKYELHLEGKQLLTHEQWMAKERIENEKIRMESEGIRKAWEALTKDERKRYGEDIDDLNGKAIKKFTQELKAKREELGISKDAFYKLSREGYDIENIKTKRKGFFGKKEIIVESREKGKEPFRISIEELGKYNQEQQKKIEQEARERREESFKIGNRKWREKLRGHKVRIIESVVSEWGIRVGDKKFSFGSEVKIKRTKGEIEGGWIISGFTQEGDVITVKREEKTGQKLIKKVPHEDFIKWQEQKPEKKKK